MTRNDRLKKFKTKFIIFLAFICAFTSSLFLFAACNNNQDDDVTDPSYSYTEPDDGKIANASFSYNIDHRDLSDFPVSSPSGWSKSTDNSTSSTVNSGVIDTSASGWEKLLETLYDDSDFVNYVKNSNRDEIIAAIREEKDDSEYAPTETEINDYIKNNKKDYIDNPVYDGDNKLIDADADDYVYMLNNIAKKDMFGFGTAQKVTSSSSVTVEAGKNYKLSVNVRTDRLVSKTGEEFANIRLTNSFGGNSQAEYRISKIDTQSEWKKYTIYIKGDVDYDSTFTLVLGLGYGGANSSDGLRFTEGTAYFNDIVFEETEEIPSSIIASDSMKYGSSEKIVKDVSSEGEKEEYVYVYDMSLSDTLDNELEKITNGTVNFSASADDYFFTKSNVKEGGQNITSKTIAGDASTFNVADVTGGKILTLNKASTTFKLSSADFSLAGKSFAYLTFNLKNELNKLGSTDITVDVFEKVGSEYKKTAAAATFSEASEDEIKCELLFKNNFKDGENKEFYLEIVIGPTDLSSVNYASELATGTVTVTDLKLLKGSLNEDDYITADFITGTDNPEYKLYNFFSSKADATVALYKGFAGDYTEEDDSETYNLNVAPGNFGDIVSYPTAPQNYLGISSNHIYLKEQVDGEVLATDVNDRIGTFTGSYAGIINTKHLSNYSTNGGAGLQDALNGAFETDENIQPIVIYNDESDHYGFIGNSNSVAASAYAKVSVTLRVKDFSASDKTTAYVYLVDASEKIKNVMEFTYGDQKRALSLEVTSDMMESDGWVTLNFYVATGATARDFRVEIWNGGRDGETATASKGYVFVKDITVTTSGAFTEPTDKNQAFSVLTGNPLAEATKAAFDNGELVSFTRELTETEKEFNQEYPDKVVSYKENYIWAKNDVMIYAVYNTVDPVESNPYDGIEEDDPEGSGCNAETDPSTFWLSFSSILLAVILVLAIVALIVKRVRRRAKANKNDAKAHYKVRSRIQTSKDNKKRAEKKTEIKENEAEEPAPNEEPVPQPENEGEQNANEKTVENQDLDSYVYGEVQDFGDAETNEEPEDK